MPEKQGEENVRRAQLVRTYEASCKIEFPTPDESNFRLAVMKALGVSFNLREVRDKEIAGPVTETRPRPQRRPGQ